MSVSHTTPPPALSPEARALLAEIQGGAPASGKSGRNQALAAAFHNAPDSGPDSGSAIGDVPVTLAPPHDDPKAAAFADMLAHLDDQVSATPKAAAAAEKFSVERSRSAARMDAVLDEMPDDKMAASDETDFEATAADGDMAAMIVEEEIGDYDPDAEADFDFELDEKPAGLMGFFKRLGGKSGRAVKRLVGVKDASAAYNAQSGASLLPFTIIRVVVLILVAAVPPIVNLAIIQPQISDNNRKITETLSFEAKSKEDEKVADQLGTSIANVERRGQVLLKELMPEADLQELVGKYVAALQRYGIDLNSYNVSSDNARKVVINDMVQDAVIVELDLVSRYDVYAEIRNVFAAQVDKMSVIDEKFQAQPGSVDLKVKSRVMVPVRRAFDAELDKPEDGGK